MVQFGKFWQMYAPTKELLQSRYRIFSSLPKNPSFPFSVHLSLPSPTQQSKWLCKYVIQGFSSLRKLNLNSLPCHFKAFCGINLAILISYGPPITWCVVATLVPSVFMEPAKPFYTSRPSLLFPLFDILFSRLESPHLPVIFQVSA